MTTVTFVRGMRSYTSPNASARTQTAAFFIALMVLLGGCQQYLYKTGFVQLQTGLAKDRFLEAYAKFPPNSSRTFVREGETWDVFVFNVYDRRSIELGYPRIDHYEYAAFRSGRLTEWGTGDGTLLREHLQFTQARVARVRVGMPEADVITLFGQPDERKVGTFGSAVGDPWNGLTYRYKFRDRSYSSARIYVYNEFVFSLDYDRPLLNHYSIEIVYEGDDAYAVPDLADATDSGTHRPVPPATEPATATDSYSTGTGVVVHPDGLILTASHVIGSGRNIVVKLADGRILDAEVVRRDTLNDLALLRVDARTEDYLTLSRPRTATIGEDVFTIGFPAMSVLGQESKFTEGSISALSGPDDLPSLMQISVPLQPGSSGGPLVNDRGEVIGIVIASAAIANFVEMTGTLPQNVNWAVKADYAVPLFDAPASLEEPRNRSEAIERTSKAVCVVIARD